MTVKDAVALHLPAAYADASSDGRYPTSPRQIYYQLRPRRDRQDGPRLRLLLGEPPAALRAGPPETAAWRVFRKARGQVIEPHTGRLIPLGTAEVADYREQWTNGLDHLGVAFEMPEWLSGTVGPRNRYGGLAPG
jgi:hypothetical protein